MSLAEFQSALVRMVGDADWRKEVHASGRALQSLDLDEREICRLRKVAGDRGLGVTARLVRGFRLGKILTLLPMTRTLLGDEALGQVVRGFWAVSPPRTFYALEEAVAFADYLLRSQWACPFVPEVVAFERALLELRRPRPEGESAPTLAIAFRHDPRCVLGPLSEGRRPSRHLPARPCLVHASIAADGALVWS